MKRLCSVNLAFASAQKGADTYHSEWLHVGSLHELIVLVNVTALSGTTKALQITPQTSPNASTDFDLATFTEIQAVSKSRISITNFGKYVRLKAKILGTGTPTFTFEAFIVAKS